jgi:hypothetical protein
VNDLFFHYEAHILDVTSCHEDCFILSFSILVVFVFDLVSSFLQVLFQLQCTLKHMPYKTYLTFRLCICSCIPMFACLYFYSFSNVFIKSFFRFLDDSISLRRFLDSSTSDFKFLGTSRSPPDRHCSHLIDANDDPSENHFWIVKIS